MSLKAGDLDELVLPEISIDEWESKIQDDAIVVGFYIDDEDPAYDFSKFIEKGGLDILDADVSPAPNENGYYMVFVEFVRNDNFPDNLDEVLQTAENITNIAPEDIKWTGYRLKKTYPYKKELVKKYIRLEEAKDDEITDESVLKFLQNSLLEDAYFVKDMLVLEEGIKKLPFRVVDFGDKSDVNPRLRINERELRLDSDARQIDKTLQKSLGYDWEVNTYNNISHITHPDDERALVLKHTE